MLFRAGTHFADIHTNFTYELGLGDSVFSLITGSYSELSNS